jgi:hypothetical protein
MPNFSLSKCAWRENEISFQGFFKRETVSKETCRCLKVKTSSKRTDGLFATNCKQPLYVTILVAMLCQTLLPGGQYCQSQWL